jgi:hypothetical protein
LDQAAERASDAARQLVGMDERRAALRWGLWHCHAAGTPPLAQAESGDVVHGDVRNDAACCDEDDQPPDNPLQPPPPPPLPPHPQRVVTVLVPPARSHPGAGSYVVDGAFDEAFLRRLEATWRCLPSAPPEKASCSERAYFYDAEGWVRRAFARALAGVGSSTSDDDEGDDHQGGGDGGDDGDDDSGDSGSRTSSRRSGRGSDGAGNAVCSHAEKGRRWPLGVRAAMAPLRFLHYPHAGGALPPHIDLARAHPTAPGLRSTHTFLLYLSDCKTGGETALLDHLPAPTSSYEGAAAALAARPQGDDPANTLAAVAPKRGRLLFFPHSCPHEGRAVVAAPKVFLRGELY